MKKTLLFFASALLFSIFLISSCQKSEYNQNKKNATKKPIEDDIKNSASSSSTWGISRHYTGYPFYYCFAPPIECFDDIIIRQPKYIELLSCVSGGSTYVSAYFNDTNWYSSIPGLLESSNEFLLTDLQSGEYYLEEEVNINTGRKYILVKDTSLNEEQDPKYVMEFIID